jgi:hypothetical protein
MGESSWSFGRPVARAGAWAINPEVGRAVPAVPCRGAPPATETAPTQRDAHLRCIAERGRMGWQRTSGYNWRALVEMVCSQTINSA